MKKSFLMAVLLISATAAFSQSEKFTQAMKNNIARFDSARTADDMLSLAAAFERIAEAEKTQWLPYYYAGFCQVLYGFQKNDPVSNDAIADKAEQLLNKAVELDKSNSEIACVKSMIASLRMLADPQNRWQQYGAMVMTEIEKAKALDPANPRPYFLQGQNLRYTPEQFGGGCTAAKPFLEEALKKYETFRPASEIHPSWGRSQVEELLAGCK
jgi:hypothetical protein